MSVLHVRAWYDGGRILDGESLRGFPEEGAIQFVEFEHGVTKGGTRYRRIVDGGDWYFLDDLGRIQRVDPHPEQGQWAEKPGGCSSCIKRSAPHLPDDVFERLSAEAQEATWA